MLLKAKKGQRKKSNKNESEKRKTRGGNKERKIEEKRKNWSIKSSKVK